MAVASNNASACSSEDKRKADIVEEFQEEQPDDDYAHFLELLLVTPGKVPERKSARPSF